MSSLLVPVVGAPSAGATPVGFPLEDLTNFARAGSNVEYPGGLERMQIIGASFDSGFSVYDATNLHFNAIHEPGGSAMLTVKWGFDKDPGYPCIASEGNPTEIRVEIRHPGGSQVGTTDWIPTLGAAGAVCQGSVTRTVHFDNDPLDEVNDGGALAEGGYEIYIRAEGDSGGIGSEGANLSGADSRGAAGNGPHLGLEFYSTGWFTVSSTLLFNESFTAPNDSAWDAARWSTNSNGTTKDVDVQNNEGRMAINNASARATANMPDAADSEIGFTYRFDNPSKTYLRVYLRWLNDSGYRVELRPDNGTIKLQKKESGSTSTIDSFTYSEDTTDPDPEQFRFQVDGNQLRVKVWKAGDPEPEDWQIDKEDSSIGQAGEAEIYHNWSSTNGGDYQAVHFENLYVWDLNEGYEAEFEAYAVGGGTGRWQDKTYPDTIGFLAMSADAGYSGFIRVEHAGTPACNPAEQDLTAQVWANVKGSTQGQSDMDRWGNGVWMWNESCQGSVTWPDPNSDLPQDRPTTFNYTTNLMDTGIFWDTDKGHFYQPKGGYIGGRVRRDQARAEFCVARGAAETTCGDRAFVQINWTKWVGQDPWDGHPYRQTSDDYRRRLILHETGHSHGLVDCPPPYSESEGKGMMNNGKDCKPWDDTLAVWNARDRKMVSSIYPLEP